MSVLYNSNCLYEDEKGIKYSCDNIRIQGLISDDEWSQSNFAQYFNDDKNIRTTMSINTGLLKYKYMWNIACKNTSITVLHSFNGIRCTEEDRKKVVLEFNPNKMEYDDFVEIQKIISNLVELTVIRMDMAIDIPVARKYVHLKKGNKNYEYHDYNQDGITEYTGIRNECGRCKVYDKTKESQLDYPLTRFEITCKPSIIEFKKKLSKVIIEHAEYQEEMLCCDNLSPLLQEMIVLLQSLDVQTRIQKLNKLSKYIKKKISPYVLGDTYELSLDYKCVQAVFDWVSTAVLYKQFTPNV